MFDVQKFLSVSWRAYIHSRLARLTTIRMRIKREFIHNEFSKLSPEPALIFRSALNAAIMPKVSYLS